MKIGDRMIDAGAPPYVIAELGVNHDGSAARALELVDAAHRSGADAVKLQLFETGRLLSRAARTCDYQRAAGATDPFAMLRALELPVASMAPLVARAHALGLHAVVTIFSVELIPDAETLSFDAYKTASTDVINRPLIEALMATGKPLFVSTGAASDDEVAAAAAWVGPHPHVLMHCVSRYPTPDEHAHLAGRIALMAISPVALGYSDHTTGRDTGALAVASGATVLEKHLTLDRAAAGPDHAASLEPDELTEYVRLAHRAWMMRGRIEKRVAPEERDVREAARQSITTTCELPAGHVLRREDLTIKRPGCGLPPAFLEAIAGRSLARAVAADVPLTEDDLA